MHWEINVGYNGRHYFATAERSLTEERAALALAREFRRLFPESEGFCVTLRRVETRMTQVKIDD